MGIRFLLAARACTMDSQFAEQIASLPSRKHDSSQAIRNAEFRVLVPLPHKNRDFDTISRFFSFAIDLKNSMETKTFLTYSSCFSIVKV